MEKLPALWVPGEKLRKSKLGIQKFPDLKIIGKQQHFSFEGGPRRGVVLPSRARMGHLLAVLCLTLLTYAVPDANAQLTGYRRVHSWGSNRFGELGIDHVDGQSSQAKPDQCEPDFVPTLGHEALLETGANLQRIISGQNHVVAITEEGNLYVWGRNDMGQLGLGFADAEDTRTRFKPTFLELFSSNGAKLEVIDAAVGLEHTVVLINGGRVYSWGSNQYGQLGIDVTPDLTPFTSVPTPIDVGGELVMNVSAAAGHSVALSFTGGVYTWGANQEGQLGLGGCSEPDGRGFDPCLNFVKKPTKILRTAENSFMPQMKLIAAGGHVTGGTEKVLEGGHTVSVSLTNEVWGWGDNFHGQVGKAQEYTRVTDFAEVYTPNKFDNVTGKYYNREVLPVRVGPLRITTSQPSPPPPPPAFPAPPGTVAQNSTETAATGTTTPSAATPETNPEIVAIAAGSHHNVALLRTGEMFAWGDNFFGQLGLGYQSLQREPDIFHKTQEWRAPEMIDRPTRIEHFDYVTLETKTEIRGNVSVELEYTVQVTGKIEWELDARITQVDAGFFQSIALSSKGNVYTWGTNNFGQQGTCGCGACMHNYEAAGTCSPITAPPAPPSPTAPDASAGVSTPADFTFEPNYENYLWEEDCQCNCAGAGTCTYIPPQGDNDAINAGKCVGFGAETMCECTPPYLDMQGYIWKMDQPMHFALGVETNFTFVSVAAGGAMFAISQADCPTDDVGNPCSGIGDCLEAEEEGALATCACPFGTAVSI